MKTHVWRASLAAALLCAAAVAQQRPQIPNFTSPEVRVDHTIVFRVYAPNAQSVRLSASDIPGMANAAMTKADNGVWQVVTAADPGAYRYSFNIDGTAFLDPHNTSVSESNTNNWSMVYVPGAAFMDTRDVPRGGIEEVTYFSKVLNTYRRLHVYTPPGYETSSQNYPIFYLLHGAGDSDDSWSTVGRAGFILDNLIAANKAKPMIVVMPKGHIPAQPGASNGRGGGLSFNDAFIDEFEKDIMPMVETRYRVQADRAHRAIAGLSMGGAHTLNIGIPNLEKFGYLGVFSSGLLGTFGAGRGRGGQTQAPNTEWEDANKAKLEDASLKKGLKLFWFSTGSDDFLLENTKSTVAFFKKYGFDPEFH